MVVGARIGTGAAALRWGAAALLIAALVACGSDEDEHGAVAATPDAVTESGDVSEPDDAPDVVSDAGSDDEEVAEEVVDDVVDLEDPGSSDDVADSGPGDEDAADDEVPDASGEEEVDEDLPDTTDWTIAEICFPGKLDGSGELPGPEYDQYEPTVGTHCMGTDHQEIAGIEQVAFFGDSVTVGTPNLEHLLNVDNEHFWRNKLAEWLALEFDLDQGEPLDWGFWKTYDYFTGKGGKLESGVFKNCSKWGARNDDLAGQAAECFPDGGSEKVTLIVFTMGGNDISKINQEGLAATPEEVEAGYPAVWALAQSAVTFLEESILWATSEEAFPNGSFVVFANPFEFTDGSGDISACTPQTVIDIPGIGEFDLSTIDISVAELAGYGPWEKPEVQAEIVIWMLEEYMRIATENGVDLVWMLEHFCGHGFVATGEDADPENRCYIGPDAELWFDDTCTHPNEAGHAAIYELFKNVIEE